MGKVTDSVQLCCTGFCHRLHEYKEPEKSINAMKIILRGTGFKILNLIYKLVRNQKTMISWIYCLLCRRQYKPRFNAF
ncbi:MAG: hypothetical protein ACR5KV_05225 [Wolbachia sp.]